MQDGWELCCLRNLVPKDGARRWEWECSRAAPRASLLTQAGLGRFAAAFSLSSFEISQLPPASTTCPVSEERCGWLPATIGELHKEQDEITLSERNTETFPPGSPCKSVLSNCGRGRISERAEDFLWEFSKKCSLVFGKCLSACSAAKLLSNCLCFQHNLAKDGEVL